MKQLERFLEQYPKKYLVFDFDETLFTLDLPWHIYRDEMISALTVFNAGTRDERGTNDFENRVVAQVGEEARQIRNEITVNFEKNHLKGYQEHRQLTDFIRQHHSDYEQIFVWSSNSKEAINQILKENNLIDYFAKIVTKEDVVQTKPEAEGFEQLIYIPDTSKTEYLMIGNSLNDQAAADAAGIDFFLVDFID